MFNFHLKRFYLTKKQQNLPYNDFQFIKVQNVS